MSIRPSRSKSAVGAECDAVGSAEVVVLLLPERLVQEGEHLAATRFDIQLNHRRAGFAGSPVGAREVIQVRIGGVQAANGRVQPACDECLGDFCDGFGVRVEGEYHAVFRDAVDDPISIGSTCRSKHTIAGNPNRQLCDAVVSRIVPHQELLAGGRVATAEVDTTVARDDDRPGTSCIDLTGEGHTARLKIIAKELGARLRHGQSRNG